MGREGASLPDSKGPLKGISLPRYKYCAGWRKVNMYWEIILGSIIFLAWATLFIGVVFDNDWIMSKTRADRLLGRKFARILYGFMFIFIIVSVLYAIFLGE
jgi:hypothetical protein